MDIFAHAFWAVTAGKIAVVKNRKSLNSWLMAWWGIFPDLFAFTIPFVWLIYKLTFGGESLSDLPRPDEMSPATEQVWVFQLASFLYNISHSLIVFVLAFAITFYVLKKPRWEIISWLIHIIIDIPTHSYQFYPTPFLWPVSSWKFDGVSWDRPWFMAVNFLAIVITYFLVFRKKKRTRGL